MTYSSVDNLQDASCHLVSAKEQLGLAVISLQRAGDCFETTIKAIKETIGDLDVSASQLQQAVHEHSELGPSA